MDGERVSRMMEGGCVNARGVNRGVNVEVKIAVNGPVNDGVMIAGGWTIGEGIRLLML